VRVLQQRGLSIHYVVGYDGAVKQCADPATTVCFHAGSSANERFIGVEIANKALGTPSPKRSRTPVNASAHGRKFIALDFTDAQYASVLRLADELSERFAIPRVTAPGDGVIDIRKFTGHAEHIHVSKRKIDCGGLVMTALRARGYA
jgi:N-acetyl-anhydromuramyl-L-alanine amidase AmpD